METITAYNSLESFQEPSDQSKSNNIKYIIHFIFLCYRLQCYSVSESRLFLNNSKRYIAKMPCHPTSFNRDQTVSKYFPPYRASVSSSILPISSPCVVAVPPNGKYQASRSPPSSLRSYVISHCLPTSTPELNHKYQTHQAPSILKTSPNILIVYLHHHCSSLNHQRFPHKQADPQSYTHSPFSPPLLQCSPSSPSVHLYYSSSSLVANALQ